jgi:uncharacterized protein YbbK (DUF523 family)
MFSSVEAKIRCVSEMSIDLKLFKGATAENPLRILFSACLLSERCGWDAHDYPAKRVQEIASLPNVIALRFCPENFSFGTPRQFSTIRGGDGFDVLDGRAQVVADDGSNWTDGAVKAAHRMLDIAHAAGARLAILLDISPACGSRVIYNGRHGTRTYRRGVGVSAALLIRHGYLVLTHRDERFLEELQAILKPDYIIDREAVNHFEDAWFREYFEIDI